MSMSQEEIEALMNGIEETSEPSEVKEEVIEEPVVVDAPVIQTNNSSVTVDNNELDELINSVNNSEPEVSITSEDIESIEDEDLKKLLDSQVEEVSSSVVNDESSKSWADGKIEEGLFPFPVDKDTKVVNQLSEVASDQEEKASQIFDVLSLVLDNNDIVLKETKKIDEFIASQSVLLKMLNEKFPNIEQFKTNLELASSLKDNTQIIFDNIDAENMEIFAAMELMQFNDINRQKIERVMSVIRKLSSYLNNLFEDDNSHKEIVVAKHISGDAGSDLMNSDDLESLIDSYSKGQ